MRHATEDPNTNPPVTFTVFLKEGDSCIAWWPEDHIWYNARVESVVMGGARVMFTDYGNSCLVGTEYLATNQDLIPDGELVDRHVGQNG